MGNPHSSFAACSPPNRKRMRWEKTIRQQGMNAAAIELRLRYMHLLPRMHQLGSSSFQPLRRHWCRTELELSSANRNHCMQGIRHSLLPHYVCNAMSMLLLIIQKLKMMLTVRNRKTKHVKKFPPLTLLSHTHVNQSCAETALWEVDQTELIWRPIGVSPRRPGVFYTQDIF